MKFKITVSEINERTGRPEHLFTADNIHHKSQALRVWAALKVKFPVGKYVVGAPVCWQEVGHALDVPSSVEGDENETV